MTPDTRDLILTNLRARTTSFARQVQPLYSVLQWTWYDGIPTVTRIEEVLEKLLDSLDAGSNVVETGGLRITIDPDAATGTMEFIVDDIIYG
jgi:hypothetical protein